MASAAGLPFITPLVILKAKMWLKDYVHKGLETDIQVLGNDMWAALNVFPDNLAPNRLVCSKELIVTGQLAMEITPLEISAAKGDKYRRHLRRKESSLGLKSLALVLPKGASSGQV
jgi:hypothetical protein